MTPGLEFACANIAIEAFLLMSKAARLEASAAISVSLIFEFEDDKFSFETKTFCITDVIRLETLPRFALLSLIFPRRLSILESDACDSLLFNMLREVVRNSLTGPSVRCIL